MGRGQGYHAIKTKLGTPSKFDESLDGTDTCVQQILKKNILISFLKHHLNSYVLILVFENKNTSMFPNIKSTTFNENLPLFGIALKLWSKK